MSKQCSEIQPDRGVPDEDTDIIEIPPPPKSPPILITIDDDDDPTPSSSDINRSIPISGPLMIGDGTIEVNLQDVVSVPADSKVLPFRCVVPESEKQRNDACVTKIIFKNFCSGAGSHAKTDRSVPISEPPMKNARVTEIILEDSRSSADSHTPDIRKQPELIKKVTVTLGPTRLFNDCASLSNSQANQGILPKKEESKCVNKELMGDANYVRNIPLPGTCTQSLKHFYPLSQTNVMGILGQKLPAVTSQLPVAEADKPYIEIDFQQYSNNVLYIRAFEDALERHGIATSISPKGNFRLPATLRTVPRLTLKEYSEIQVKDFPEDSSFFGYTDVMNKIDCEIHRKYTLEPSTIAGCIQNSTSISTGLSNTVKLSHPTESASSLDMGGITVQDVKPNHTLRQSESRKHPVEQINDNKDVPSNKKRKTGKK